MKFRRLYWVTEQLDDDGRSEIAGVFTSIPDLLDKGIRWNDAIEKSAAFRISLVKLDSTQRPLGVWCSPDFDRMKEDLEEFIHTDEISEMEREQLLAELSALVAISG